MTPRPRQHDDGRGRHTTHAPFHLSDEDEDGEDENFDLGSYIEGFDPDPEDT